MKWVLHLGMAKTASTFLQSAFAVNADELRAQGWHYPMLNAKVRSDLQLGRVHSGNAPVRDTSLHLARYQSEASDLGIDRILLSSETVTTANPTFLDDPAFEGTVPHLVFYVRHPVDWTRSVYLQTVTKTGQAHRPIPNLADAQVPILAWKQKMNLLRAAVQGAESGRWSLALLPYTSGRNFLADWDQILDLPPNTLSPPPLVRINRSPSTRERRLYHKLHNFNRFSNVRRVIDELSYQFPDVQGEKPAYPEAVLTSRLAEWAADWEAIKSLSPERFAAFDWSFDFADHESASRQHDADRLDVRRLWFIARHLKWGSPPSRPR